jgi:hypothetical protein
MASEKKIQTTDEWVECDLERAVCTHCGDRMDATSTTDGAQTALLLIDKSKKVLFLHKSCRDEHEADDLSMVDHVVQPCAPGAVVKARAVMEWRHRIYHAVKYYHLSLSSLQTLVLYPYQCSGLESFSMLFKDDLLPATSLVSVNRLLVQFFSYRFTLAPKDVLQPPTVKPYHALQTFADNLESAWRAADDSESDYGNLTHASIGGGILQRPGSNGLEFEAVFMIAPKDNVIFQWNDDVAEQKQQTMVGFLKRTEPDIAKQWMKTTVQDGERLVVQLLDKCVQASGFNANNGVTRVRPYAFVAPRNDKPGYWSAGINCKELDDSSNEWYTFSNRKPVPHIISATHSVSASYAPSRRRFQTFPLLVDQISVHSLDDMYNVRTSCIHPLVEFGVCDE